MLTIHMMHCSTQSIQELYSLILSSQVAVEDGGFGSLALNNQPAMISFSINSPNEVSLTHLNMKMYALIQLTTQFECTFWDFTYSYVTL